VRIRKGDKVRVLQGKDRGHEGTVMRVLPGDVRRYDRVIVEGVNRVKKHQRATRATMQGGIIDRDMPLPASSVAIVCSNCGPTRIGVRFDEAGVKQRVCRKCGGDL